MCPATPSSYPSLPVLKRTLTTSGERSMNSQPQLTKDPESLREPELQVLPFFFFRREARRPRNATDGDSRLESLISSRFAVARSGVSDWGHDVVWSLVDVGGQVEGAWVLCAPGQGWGHRPGMQTTYYISTCSREPDMPSGTLTSSYTRNSLT